MATRLLVLSPKGGSGKSTICRNIAAVAAEDGLAVGVLDTDDQGTLAKWGGTRQRHSDLPAISVHFCPLSQLDEVETPEGLGLFIIDTPTAIEAYPAQVKALIESADLVLVPTQPTADDVGSVMPIMAMLQDSRKPSAFVVNRVRPRVLEVEAARRELGAVGPVIAASLPDSVEIQRAMMDGKGITETAGKGQAEMRAIWREIARMIERQHG